MNDEKVRLLKLKELLAEYNNVPVEKAETQPSQGKDSASLNMGGYVKTMTNPTTGAYRFTEREDSKKTAFSSAAMLGFMTLLFEGLFLLTSYFIFK